MLMWPADHYGTLKQVSYIARLFKVEEEVRGVREEREREREQNMK